MSTYEEQVAQRLTQVYREASVPTQRELDRTRIVLLSDLHKGRRDGADDFQQCELTYQAAIHHYWQQGYELWLLGDIEELWENWPQPVIDAYNSVLREEQAFAEAISSPRYVRLVGNHDDMWYDPEKVRQHLGPYLGGQPILEGVRVAIRKQGESLGELFLVHGHQGTLDSDRYAGISAWVVRHIWRPLQRLLRIKTSTPSNNFELKKQHEMALYAWAAAQSGTILVAGHTHHPVWEGLSYQQALERELPVEGISASAERLWIEQEIGGRIDLPGEKPCYFNTGCCSYSDGTCTALELADGRIRLVRWEPAPGAPVNQRPGGPNAGPASERVDIPDQPSRIEIFSAALEDVLRQVAER